MTCRKEVGGCGGECTTRYSTQSHTFFLVSFCIGFISYRVLVRVLRRAQGAGCAVVTGKLMDSTPVASTRATNTRSPRSRTSNIPFTTYSSPPYFPYVFAGEEVGRHGEPAQGGSGAVRALLRAALQPRAAEERRGEEA